MSKLKETFFPALAGMDYIHEAQISPESKLILYSAWNNPHASRKALKALKLELLKLQSKEVYYG